MITMSRASEASVLSIGFSSWYIGSAHARWNAPSPTMSNDPTSATWPDPDAASSRNSKAPASRALARDDRWYIQRISDLRHQADDGGASRSIRDIAGQV